MSIIFDCPDCHAEMDVRRLHRGRKVPCPACGADVDVPERIDFSGRVGQQLADRRVGERLLLVASLSCALWFPIFPAIAWFWSMVRIHRARDDDRAPTEPLLMARTVAIVAFIAQMAYYGTALTGTRFWDAI